ncbi:hydrolytic protein [Streptomyces sp. NRRL F-5123]|uniref:COG1470 family protein n=1 Tax=Streptomyces sp. NRRL F-5123 TaxID=1463856 RepID=UPI000B2EE443|nr:hydrolytic protein [Streptomyces sp. NRRL F-5123]
MTPSAASSGTGAPGLDIPEVAVAPGGTATTTLTVRNDSDIVEAYSLEVVGDCAPWTTVEPARVSLYPGTAETVTIRLDPPRSPEVRAGAVPLAVRVLPAEHPEAVRVPETTVHISEFHELRTELLPRRRRGWLRGRYRLAVRNQGNTPVRAGFTPGQAGDELKFAFAPSRVALEPGESAELRLLVRTGRPIWFGRAVTRPFTLTATEYAMEPVTPEIPVTDETAVLRPPLDGEFVQIPIFPRWLLAVLAAIIALLLAWFALVRPTVRSTAKAAANKVVHPQPSTGAQNAPTPGDAGAAPTPSQGSGTQASTGGSGGTSGGTGGTGVTGSQQSSQTIDVKASGGQTKTGVYQVPAGQVFRVTDLVVANFQGDEGVLTITFGDRKITTIALETFRNQDYHWVTPIEVNQNETVSVEVTCQKPGTPATGKQSAGCHELLNVSGLVGTITN